MTTTKTRAPYNGATTFDDPFGTAFDTTLSTNGLDLDALSDAELEALLFRDEEASPSGLWNLPTLTGLSLVGVGVAYILQQFDLWAGDLTMLVASLPIIAGVFIVLLGMGVLSWRPSKRKKKRRRKAAKRRVADAFSSLTGSAAGTEADGEQAKTKTKRLRKSKRNKKLMGVCGGLGEYLNLDPTFVRIAFIIGLIATEGAFFVGYFVLAYALPKAETLSEEERLRIIRES